LPENPVGYEKSGDAYFNLQRYNESIEAYAKAIKLSPESTLYWKSGNVLVARGDYQRALEMFEKARERDPDDPESYFSMGQLYGGMGQQEKALEQYKRVIELAPTSTVGYDKSGDVYLDLGKYDKALEAYAKVTELTPGSSVAYWKRGEAYRAKGEFESALKMYRKARELDSQNPDPCFAMGLTFEAQAKYEQALEQYQGVIELAPQESAGYEKSGDIYFTLQNDEDALKAYAKVIELTPEAASAYWKTGEVRRTQGALEQALEMYDKAIKLEPDNADYFYGMGQVYEMLKQQDQALICFDKVVELLPDNPVAYSTRAEVNLSSQRFRQALLDYDRLVELEPGSAEGYFGRGRVYEAQEAYSEAVEEFSKAIDRDPESPFAYNSRGQIYLNRKQYNEAQSDYTQAVHLARNANDVDTELTALSGLAVSLYFDEKYQESFVEVDRMLLLEPDYVWALTFKGDLLLEFAKYADAAKLFQRANSLEPLKDDAFVSMGWAFENLGKEKAAEAQNAYKKAILSNADNLWAHKGIANALRLLGETEAAAAKYRYVIAHSDDSNEQQSLLGWCHYSVGQYEEAIRCFETSLASKPKDLATHFDFALVRMCSGQYQLAHTMYQKNLENVEMQQPLKRRGLIFIALDDFTEAVTTLQLATVKECEAIKRLLDAAWEKVKML
jgi:tetratricopeptide (TPR) repeat protein